jgi:hypothetical protein
MEIVWRVIEVHLPELKIAVAAMLANPTPP